MFSDSLGYEAKDEVGRELDRRFTGKMSFTYDGLPSVALCDYTERILSAIAAHAADVIALEFSGNGFSDCTKGTDAKPLVGDALLDRYRSTHRHPGFHCQTARCARAFLMPSIDPLRDRITTSSATLNVRSTTKPARR
jgi:hypothetical protein